MTLALDLDALAFRFAGAVGLTDSNGLLDGVRVDCRRLEGGTSGLTLELVVYIGDASRRYVAKCVPPGRNPSGRHDVFGQAQVMSHLALLGQVPVPRLLAIDESAPAFVVMEFVEGRISEPIMDHSRPRSEAEIASAWSMLVETLCALHDSSTHGLSTPSHRRLSPADELSRWSETMRLSAQFDDDRSRAVRLALERTTPAQTSQVLVHGDFRLGNVVEVDGQIRAVFDWEIWALADRRSELGWTMMFLEPGLFLGDVAVSGLPTSTEVLDQCKAHGGASLDGVAWFAALQRYKGAAIARSSLRRADNDDTAAAFGEQADRMLASAAAHLF
ncbi:MAG: phosphotransferase family protein [Ilumatobacteraceae bacterium]